jgi:hypothetical protein
MGLEAATYISGLVASNPVSGDLVDKGDDHIRLLKAVLQSTLPGANAAITATSAELNKLAGATVTTAELNLLQGKTGVAGGGAKLDAFAAATKMLFYQSAAPTGWTRVVDAALNDHALRVVTSGAWTSGTQGTNAFSAQFASLAEGASPGVGSHTLVAAEIPAHTHGLSAASVASGGASHTHNINVKANSTATGSVSVAGSSQAADVTLPTTATTAAHTHGLSGSTDINVGGGGGHSHTVDLRVKYLDMILCSKD